MNVFKISLPGFNVRRSRPTDDAVNSLYPNPKVDTLASPPHAGIISLNWASSGIIVPYNTTKLLYSFPHHYNYTPTAFANYSFDNGSIQAKGMMPLQIGAIGIIIIDTDSINVNLKYYSSDISGVTPVPPFTMQARFYVFAEQGTR